MQAKQAYRNGECKYNIAPITVSPIWIQNIFMTYIEFNFKICPVALYYPVQKSTALKNYEYNRIPTYYLQ